MAFDPGEYLPLIGVGLLGLTTVVSIGGAWAMGRVRGMRDAAEARDRDRDTHARIERMERDLATIAEEIERLGEVQRFALKVIGDRVISPAQESLPHGRVITPH